MTLHHFVPLVKAEKTVEQRGRKWILEVKI